MTACLVLDQTIILDSSGNERIVILKVENCVTFRRVELRNSLNEVPRLRCLRDSALKAPLTNLVYFDVVYEAVSIHWHSPEHHRCVRWIDSSSRFNDDGQVDIGVLKVARAMCVPADLTTDLEAISWYETALRCQCDVCLKCFSILCQNYRLIRLSESRGCNDCCRNLNPVHHFLLVLFLNYNYSFQMID